MKVEIPSKFKYRLNDLINVVEDKSFPRNQNLNALILYLAVVPQYMATLRRA